MAKAARKSSKTPAWQRPGSPIGRRGPRKANPKYKRHMRDPWTSADLRTLKELAKGNTPTGVISLKMGRTPAAIRNKAGQEGISLKPVNRSPRTSSKKTRSGAARGRAAAATRGRKASARGGRKGAASAGRKSAASRGGRKGATKRASASRGRKSARR